MFFGLFNGTLAIKYNILVMVLMLCCKCDSFNITSDVASVTYDSVSGLENFVSFPKKFVTNLMSHNIGIYLGGANNEDIFLNGTQLIQKYGYKVEEHYVTTDDGYILALYRIPGKGRAVFLMHGLLCSFVDWITVGPKQALPFLLADQGYDVWMGNARGNTFSRKNDRLSPSDHVFWEFSFNEIGSRDLPAMIDYILHKAGQKKLTYIGHSQGTTVFFVLCSTKPEYNDKIDLMVALAPVAWMKHIPSPILTIVAKFHDILYVLGQYLNLYEIAPDNDTKKDMTQLLCGDVIFAAIFCQNLMFLVAGLNIVEVNYKQLPVIYNHFPSGSSLMQFEHYAQLIDSGGFRKFDYGSNLNFKIYGSANPPSYPVDKITVPVALVHSRGDWLTGTADVENLRRNLKNVVNYTEMLSKNFNHVDFLWAKDVKRLLYDKLLALIKQY